MTRRQFLDTAAKLGFFLSLPFITRRTQAHPVVTSGLGPKEQLQDLIIEGYFGGAILMHTEWFLGDGLEEMYYGQHKGWERYLSATVPSCAVHTPGCYTLSLEMTFRGRHERLRYTRDKDNRSEVLLPGLEACAHLARVAQRHKTWAQASCKSISSQG